jgi:adenylyltransferase/sulfurtransferase
MALPDFTSEHQQRLENAAVVVVGAGGLGVPIVQYLASSGVGNIQVVDFDKVEESNLPRQVLYGSSDVGLPKVEVLCGGLKKLHPNLRLKSVREKLHCHNAFELLSGASLVIDATDRFAVRFLINDVCTELGIPLLSAAVTGYEGQWVLFDPAQSAVNYRDVYLSLPGGDALGNCETNGVLSTAAGIIGTLAANTAIRFLSGLKEEASVLHVFNTANLQLMHVQVQPHPSNALRMSGYSFGSLKEDYAGLYFTEDVNEVSVRELKQWIESGTDLILVDVRTAPERDQFHIGGQHLPLQEFAQKHHSIQEGNRIVLYCQKGIRSWDAAAYLKLYRPEQEIYSLEGGMVSWLRDQRV